MARERQQSSSQTSSEVGNKICPSFRQAKGSSRVGWFFFFSPGVLRRVHTGVYQPTIASGHRGSFPGRPSVLLVEFQALTDGRGSFRGPGSMGEMDLSDASKGKDGHVWVCSTFSKKGPIYTYVHHCMSRTWIFWYFSETVDKMLSPPVVPSGPRAEKVMRRC